MSEPHFDPDNKADWDAFWSEWDIPASYSDHKVMELPPSVDGPIQTGISVILVLPLGTVLPAYHASIRLAVPSGPMIVSVFGLRLEGWPDGSTLTMDLLMARRPDGTAVVLLENEQHTDEDLAELSTLPRSWFRFELVEIRSA